MIDRIYLHGLGIAAPGLAGWPSARAVLAGESPYRAAPLAPFRTQRLPRNEARRAGAGVHLAFRVAEQACGERDASRFAAVFSSSAGDIDIADQLCLAVNTPERAISPTRFHNSVHNAPAGYWSIATGTRESTTSLSAGPGGFTVALCEAWGLVAERQSPVLLVCYDIDGGGMLAEARRDIGATFAMAWLLDVADAGAMAWIERPQPARDARPTRLSIPALEALRVANASARSLPLFTVLAGSEPAAPVIESEQGHWRVPLARL
ncbi:beta-ketoacyl synthase chain length factor [Salinisphaera sp.]|uniref:beta-ketoacyl synthase chain length factor n=1 Tax=Salinisphaera sp. TaxID=1914330 RepID=UPI002D794950|nr:beta-ketoacyl synthase chain length factor [Salinisphaera sp.]HET7315701.1 beta-ketoacyl synthase chain length factor [Salinisphaera sp.]